MNKFDAPWGGTTDQEGNIYVTDTNNARIQKFKGDGTPLLKWGRDGSFDSAFSFPAAWPSISSEIRTLRMKGTTGSRSSIRGALLTKWGREGSGPGSSRLPGSDVTP